MRCREVGWAMREIGCWEWAKAPEAPSAATTGFASEFGGHVGAGGESVP